MLKILKVLLSRNWKDNLQTKTTRISLKTGVFPTFGEVPYDSSAQFLTLHFQHTFRRRDGLSKPPPKSETRCWKCHTHSKVCRQLYPVRGLIFLLNADNWYVTLLLILNSPN